MSFAVMFDLWLLSDCRKHYANNLEGGLDQ